jgi:hypothetical protein
MTISGAMGEDLASGARPIKRMVKHDPSTLCLLCK